MRQSLWLRVAAIGTWTVCGLPAMAAIARGGLATGTAMVWSAAFLTYGAALVAAFRRRAAAPRQAIALIVIQSVAAIVATTLTRGRLDAAGVDLLAGVGLMVIVAAQLPHLVAAPVAVSWIGAQTFATTIASGRGLGVADLLMFFFGAAGFQMFASMTTASMLREAEARADLARANAELHATRRLLAESSRAGERLRIARDLHDSIGHHLTALSLQLDVGSRLSSGAVRDHVANAHAITRLLLAEVRTVVGELRESGRTDVAHEIRALALAGGTIAVHLEMPESLVLDDGAQAQSIIRCVQEIVTNATRHSNARNLWIEIGRGTDGITLHAHDDGRGADTVTCGHGLRGMRERFAEYAGRVEFGGRPGRGFEVHGFMPTTQAAP